MTGTTIPPTYRRLDERELGAWRGLLEVHAALLGELDAQMRAQHGLPVTSYEVLMFLADAEDERLRMSEIADRVLLSRSGLTRTVDRLVEAGYVERCPTTDDRRGAYAKLTEAGREKVASARALHHEGIRRVFLDRLTCDEHETLAALWAKVLARPPR